MSGHGGNDDRTRISSSEDDATIVGPAERPSSDDGAIAPMRAAPSRPRVLGPYTLVRLLGRGGMGAVWEAVDFRLDRRVALKISTADPSPDAIERFRREATHSARLRHPHIVSVHDVGFDQGQQYLVMDLVQGTTLGEALRSGRLTYRRKAEILERMARAVHYAHEQGVIHRDLKPSNIMLESRRGAGSSAASSIGASAFRAADDDFGEPLVMDFGLAKDASSDSSLSRSGFAIGTPSYMPPEQAEGRLDAVSPRSDVWSLGAILYEMLTGRPPFTGESTMRVLKAVMNEEPVPPRRISRDVPRDLETISLACLRKDPARRYATAEALANDLRAYLAGESISARPATALERAVKVVKRHRLAALVLVLVMPTLLTLALLYGEHLKELASWRTIASEDFADDAWGSRWRVMCGEFVHRDDGRIASTRWGANIIAWPRMLLGPVAIDYEAEMLPGSAPCDISLIWARGLKEPDLHLEQANGFYYNLFDRPIELKIGAFDGSYSAIMINGQHVAYNPFKPEHGVRYRVRVEVVDNRISIGVDGRTLCTYTDPFPLTGGYACLFGFYPGKAFGHVRIQSLSVPQKVPATAIGDAYAQDGTWAKAAEQYARVATAHPGTAIAREAIYKQGLCEFRSGDRAAAFVTWSPLTGSEYDELVALHRLDVLAEGHDLDRLLAEMEALYRRATPATRVRVAVRWADCVHEDRPDDEREHVRIRRLLELHDRVFPDQTTVDNAASECLYYLDRWQELLDRYPLQRRLCAMALLALGRCDVVSRDYVDQRSTCAMARFRGGLFEELHQLDPEGTAFQAQALIEQGRPDEVLARYPGSVTAIDALLMLGRLDEAAAGANRMWTDYADIFAGRYGNLSTARGRVLAAMVQGRFDEAEAAAEEPYMRGWAHQGVGIQAAMRGDATAARAALVPAAALRAEVEIEYAIDQLLLVPWARELCGGEAGTFDRACDDVIADRRYAWMQCPWYIASFARGRIDEQGFLAQPRRRYAEANLHLFGGIREERAGHRDAAVERYRAYLAIKPWQRGEEPLPLRELFADWRIAALSTSH